MFYFSVFLSLFCVLSLLSVSVQQKDDTCVNKMFDTESYNDYPIDFIFFSEYLLFDLDVTTTTDAPLNTQTDTPCKYMYYVFLVFFCFALVFWSLQIKQTFVASKKKIYFLMICYVLCFLAPNRYNRLNNGFDYFEDMLNSVNTQRETQVQYARTVSQIYDLVLHRANFGKNNANYPYLKIVIVWDMFTSLYARNCNHPIWGELAKAQLDLGNVTPTYLFILFLFLFAFF